MAVVVGLWSYVQSAMAARASPLRGNPTYVVGSPSDVSNRGDGGESLTRQRLVGWWGGYWALWSGPGADAGCCVVP